MVSLPWVALPGPSPADPAVCGGGSYLFCALLVFAVVEYALARLSLQVGVISLLLGAAANCFVLFAAVTGGR